MIRSILTEHKAVVVYSIYVMILMIEIYILMIRKCATMMCGNFMIVKVL